MESSIKSNKTMFIYKEYMPQSPYSLGSNKYLSVPKSDLSITDISGYFPLLLCQADSATSEVDVEYAGEWEENNEHYIIQLRNNGSDSTTGHPAPLVSILWARNDLVSVIPYSE